MIFLIILTSCQKNNEILETNKGDNELFLEQESTDNLLDNENNNDKKLFSDNSEEYFPLTVEPRTPGLPYDDSDIVGSITHSNSGYFHLPYYYDGIGSMKFGEYFYLDDENKDTVEEDDLVKRRPPRYRDI
jgi:hypothetical protein